MLLLIKISLWNFITTMNTTNNDDDSEDIETHEQPPHAEQVVENDTNEHNNIRG